MEKLLLTLIVFIPFITGGVLALINDDDRRNVIASSVTSALCVIALLLFVLNVNPHHYEAIMNSHVSKICGFGLNFTLEGFRALYLFVTTLMWMMTTILSAEYQKHHDNKKRFLTFMLLTEGATLGVFLSADLYTTFIFFEIMSFTSYVFVAQEENEKALRAAETYLYVAIIGGLVMLMGIFILYNQFNTLEISKLLDLAKNSENKRAIFAAGCCMLVGFGAKAGAFPLHIWLPKAHPVAPAPASALLSGVLTKTGIYGVIVLSANLFIHDATWGVLILTLGTITMFLGAFLAVFSIDLKRTLACSSMSQIGFILVGIGMMCLLEERALAIRGVILHMTNHSLIKLVLFMAAGVVYMNAHSLDLTTIKGFGRKKNLLKVIFAVGALSIAGIPGFSGYVSKTLLHESIIEYAAPFIPYVEWIFLISGGFTLAYMTKLFICIFVEYNNDAKLQEKYDAQTSYMNKYSKFALTASAVILFVWGLFPNGLMGNVASFASGFMNFEGHVHQVHFFGLECLKGAAISITIGLLTYFLFIRNVLIKNDEYVNIWPAKLDLEDLVYRPILLKVLPSIGLLVCRILDTLLDSIVVLLRKTIYSDKGRPMEFDGVSKLTYLFHKSDLEKAVVAKEEMEESTVLVRRSLSLGLMTFIIGFVAIMLYLLIGL